MGSKQVENACATCGQAFFAYRYDIEERGRRFCSNDCALAPRRITRPDKDELEAKYSSGLSTNALAVEYGVSKGTIYNWFRHHNIDTRSPGEGVTLAQTGRPASESRKKAISDSHIARGSWQGEDHPNFKYPSSKNKRSNAGKRPTLDGLYVRSSWEHNYALILNLWVTQGKIVRWEYEPEHFEFPVKRGNRFYTPDFKVYLPNGQEEYHEVKGWMDQNSKVKLNRFAKHYPHKVLKLIDGTAYRSLAKEYSLVLPDWEHPAKKASK